MPETIHPQALSGIDALIPPEMAKKASIVGVTKAKMGWRNLLALSVLAGAFIALGAGFSTIATTGAAGSLPYGITRLMAGIVFSLGLILVIIAGAELFTGNNLIVMAWANREVTTRDLLRNWSIVYLGNLTGSVATALLMLLSGQYLFAKGAVGLNVLSIAEYKCCLPFFRALVLGVICNALVCMAVWLCFSCRSTTDKILAIIFPITAFVAGGFEHSIANMYFIPMGMLVKEFAGPEFWSLISRSAADFGNLNAVNFFFNNLVPVTIGNIIGGSVMVGLVYWFIYIRKPRVSPFSPE